MQPTTSIKHYGIEVYDNGPPPQNEPVETTLCPGARKIPTRRVKRVDQVTCVRCLQLLDVIGLRPILPATKKAGE